MYFLDSARARLAVAVLAALALALDGVLAHGSDAPLALVIALAVATCAPFVLPGRLTLAVVVALECGLVACVLVFRAYDAAVGILAIVLFLAALRGDRRRSLIVGAATALSLALTLVVLQTTGHGLDAGTALRVLCVLAALVLGDALRSRRELAAVRRERDAREQQERDHRARRRRAQERLAIARELHDGLAHALVAINVRAGVASHLGTDPRDAGALAEIKQVSAQALRDLRSTLDLLRDGSEDSPWRPVEGLEQLPRLLEGVKSAGLDTRAQIELAGVAVPAPISQAAFRIVQESLTNVMRHAGASHAEVSIQALAEVLAVEVIDDGRGSRNGNVTGHGLRGMSERVLALGGELSAGPLESQGWQVSVRLPLGQQVS